MKVRVLAAVHRHHLAALGNPLGGEAVEAALERVDGVTRRASKVVLTPLHVVSDERQDNVIAVGVICEEH